MPVKTRQNDMNMSFEKLLHRYGLISENLFLLEKEITTILNDLDYETWRNCDVDEEGLKQFQIILISFSFPIGQKPETNVNEESPLQTLRKLLKIYQGLFGKSLLDSEISAIVAVERDSKIESILKDNVIPKRVSPKLRTSLTIICLWLLYRIQLLTELSHLPLHEGDLTARSETLSDLSDKDESVIDSSKLRQELQNNENVLNIGKLVVSETNKKEWSISEEDMTKYLAQAFEVNTPQWVNYKNSLYILINHVCIPLSFQKKILNCVRSSVFKLMLQNEYDIRRQYMPALINQRFYLPDKPDVRTILPEDFSKKGSAVAGMKLKLSHTDIVSLYFALKGKYIETNTDIYDFAYALTGYPVDQAKFFKKVVWVADHKQTLGIFLGMLRPYSSSSADERSWYWNSAPKCFAYNNRAETLKPSELSSPFGNFQRHPEIKSADWENMDEIIQKCLKARDK